MVNLLPTIRLAQSILKRKFPSVHNPLKTYAPQKGPLKNRSPGAYFRNFTVVKVTKKVTLSSLWQDMHDQQDQFGTISTTRPSLVPLDL